MLAKNGWLCRLFSCLFALAAIWPAGVASAATCCLPDGTCAVLSTNECVVFRGSPNLFQTACGPDDCVPTPCCDRTGQCAVQTRVSCAQPSTIAAGSSCSPASCVSVGVCCVGASCTLTAPGACTGGTFNAGLSACDPSPCPLPAVCADPQFAPGPTYSLISLRTVATSFLSPLSIRAADFDRDGVPDLAVLAIQGGPNVFAVAVALRDAGGGVRELRRTALPFQAFSMAVGDFNNDSYPDAAVFGVAAPSDYRVVVLLNRGAAAPGEFTVLPSVAAGGFQGITDSRTILVSDVTGDGNADVVLSNRSVQIFAGDGTGGLAASFQLDGANFYLGAVSADFNSDGKPDLVIFDPANRGFSQYLAPVSSSSTPVASIAGYRNNSFATADLTGDSRPDLVLGSLTPGLSLAVFPAQASGVLDTSAPIVSPLGTNPLLDPLQTGLVTGDFNGDGRQDAAVLRGKGAQYMLNTGTGGLVSFGRFSGDPAPGESFAPIDLNGDGKTDLAFAAGDDITPRIFTLVAACPVACCASDGTCTVATAFCPTGTTRQSVASCSPNPCPQPQVACCDPCGVCTVVDASAGCPSGTTTSAATTCAAGTCPLPRFGASAWAPTGDGRLRVTGRSTPDATTVDFFVNSSRSGQGTTSSSMVGETARFMTAVATPNAGWRFTGWTAETPCTPQTTTVGSDGVATCTYERPCTATGNSEFQPIFERVPNIVRVTVTGPGTVTSSPAGILDCAPSGGTCQSEFPVSSILRLTANPTPGSWFTGWTQPSTPGAQVASQISPELVLALPASASTIDVTAGFAANSNPIARCRNVVIDARSACASSFTITTAQVDNGSSDADTPFGDTLTLSLSNTGPFPVGVTTVTLTATDARGAFSSCQATVTVLGQDCNNNTIPDVCECFYDNTPVPPASPARVDNAQLAHIGNGAPGAARVADDVYFGPGTINRITAFRGQMLTTAVAGTRKARLDIFEDCNGAPPSPGTPPIASFINSAIESETAVDAGLTLVSYVFDLCDPAAGGGVTPPPTVDRPAEGLWLEGGKTYWFSLTGLPASASPDDTSVSFWVTGSRLAPTIGRPPHKATGTIATWPATYDAVAWGAWENLAECCAGCVNMEFSLSGYSCGCPFDQFDTALSTVTGLPSGSFGGASMFRAADNFIVPPLPGPTCDPRSVCLIEAYIWTTCQTPRGFIEVYANDCTVQGPGELIRSLTSVTATDTLARATRDGQTFKLYRLRAALPPGSPTLSLGAGTYWLSAGATGSGAASERTFFAARRPACDTPACGINISSAVSRRTFPVATPPSPTPSQADTWLPPTAATPPAPATDLAFRIFTGGEVYPSVTPPPGNANPNPIPTPPTCRADINQSGAVTIDDIFIFLTEWFAGCP